VELKHKILRLAGAAVVAAGLLLAPTSAWAGGVTTDGACGPGDYGPFTKVVTDYGVTYVVKYGPIVDDNGTSNNASDSFTNTWAGTVTLSFSTSLKASTSEVVASVEASVTVSASASVTLTAGHTITYTISPHTSLHVEYTGKREHTYMEHYSLNSGCSVYNATFGDAWTPIGVGWHTWVTSYSG
jgi:hypothetical protein